MNLIFNLLFFYYDFALVTLFLNVFSIFVYSRLALIRVPINRRGSGSTELAIGRYKLQMYKALNSRMNTTGRDSIQDFFKK